jgi:hypothetical protein
MTQLRSAEVARAIREEIIRQYLDNDRAKCPAGVPFWEEEVQPMLLAEVAVRSLAALRMIQNPCETCKGTGKTPDEKQFAGWKYWSTYWCPDCKGTGRTQPNMATRDRIIALLHIFPYGESK